MTDENIQKIMQTLSQYDVRLKKLESMSTDGRPPKTKQMSLKEFLLEKKPKGDIERTLAIAYFLENERNVEPISAKDLEEGYRESKEKVPGNINRKIIGCISRGFMQEAKEKKNNRKAWTLTSTGERYVESKFQNK